MLKVKKISIDVIRFIASFLIVAIHISPFVNISGDFDFFFTRILGRIAVPLYLMITGYFLLDKSLVERNKLVNYIKKIIKMYILAIIIYIPINIYNGVEVSILSLIKSIFITGTMYHLWYFPALILGILITYYLLKKLGLTKSLIITLILYIFGLLGDSYYGLISSSSINVVYSIIFSIFDYTRNGIFYVPIFLLLGYLVKIKPCKLHTPLIYAFFFFILMSIEGFTLHNLNWQKHDSMYLFLIPLMYYLFSYFMSINCKADYKWRNMATTIYLLHPLFIVVVRFAAGLLGIKDFIVNNNLILYLLVLMLSVLCAYLLEKWKELRFKMKNNERNILKDRAWVSISLTNLQYNLAEIKKVINKDTKIMAVVKANAYGHDSVLISKYLEKNGINDFAVATIDEGIQLRKNGIKGNILILGYTNIDDLNEVVANDLIQTIVDYDYAEKIKKSSISKLKCHIKINTGMNRLGEKYNNYERLKAIYENDKLDIKGTFSHLCVADSNLESDIIFTKKQIANFNDAINYLKENHCNVGKVHLQSSYGAINYNENTYDFVRIGILMYGINSDSNSYMKNRITLKPVLSLKARVSSVKEIAKDESVSYGRRFIARGKTRIASITIGYADGIFRSLSENKIKVKINDHYYSVIGRICMDQMIVEINDDNKIKEGDIAYLIDRDDDNLSAVKLAESANTITNETLSCLSHRLPRIDD